MLTEEENWLFDLHGYIILRQIVSRNEVARMVALFDQWHGLAEADLPPPLASYGPPKDPMAGGAARRSGL